MAPESPVFTGSDEEDLQLGERWASDPVLGSGYHATAVLKLVSTCVPSGSAIETCAESS